MKKVLALLMVVAMGFLAVSCACTGYNTQRGAAIGAGLGAIAGQAIGRNTEGTLIGMAAGALAGTIFGNAVDQHVANQRAERSRQVYAAPANGTYETPPGEWVTVPGRWSGGRWVPAHRVWVPVNP